VNAPVANDTLDKTRELQLKLYRAAKRSPARRFHALYDKVYRRDILERGWEEVGRNRGAPGVDGLTIAQIESQGVEGFLDDLAVQLRDGSYRPLPVRRVSLPYPAGGRV
jgi:RNA-directed DNA polymerase